MDFLFKAKRERQAQQLVEPQPWCVPDIPKQGIRVVLFHENAMKQRRLIYDTELEGGGGHVTEEQAIPRRGHSGGSPRKPRDEDLLGEMLFGSIPLAFQGTTTKVHEIKQPKRVVMSKVFAVPLPVLASGAVDLAGSEACMRTRSGSSSGLRVPCNTLPNVIPEAPASLLSGMSTVHACPPSPTSSPHRSRTGFRMSSSSSSTAVISIPDSGVSSGNRHGRAMAHSLANGPSSRGVMLDEDTASDDLNDSVASHPGEWGDVPRTSLHRGVRSARSTLSDLSQGPRARRLMRSATHSIEAGLRRHSQADTARAGRVSVFAVAVIFTVEANATFQEFLFSHFAVLELRFLSFTKACVKLVEDTQDFLAKQAASSNDNPKERVARQLGPLLAESEPLVQRIAMLCQQIRHLYEAPRIQSPLWLNITTFSQLRASLQTALCRELFALIPTEDAGRTFLCSALTGVLTGHLGWVASVLPTSSSAEQLSRVTPSNLVQQANRHPYDPLWAQLSDLYGAVSSPTSCCRTVVYGRNKAVTYRLLYVLSYFIRCNEVFDMAIVHDGSALIEREASASSNSGSSRSSSKPAPPAETKSNGHRPQGRAATATDTHPHKFHNMAANDSTGGHGLDTAAAEIPTPAPCSIADVASTTTIPPTTCLAAVATNPEKDTANPDPTCNGTRSAPAVDGGDTLSTHDSDTEEAESSRRARSDSSSHSDSGPDVTGRTAAAEAARWQAGDSSDEDTRPRPKPRQATPLRDCVSGRSAKLTQEAISAHSKQLGFLDDEFPDKEKTGFCLTDFDTSGFETVDMRPDTCVRVVPDLSQDAMDCQRPSSAASESHAFSRTFGRSLLLGMQSQYVAGAILQGLSTADVDRESIVEELKTDLSHSVLAAQLRASSCLLIDTSRQTCQLLTAEKTESGVSIRQTAVAPSFFTMGLLSAFQGLYTLGVADSFCVENVEDHLQGICQRSRVMVAHLQRDLQEGDRVNAHQLASRTGVHAEDVPLLLAVANVLCPSIEDRIVLDSP
eukprot:m.75689 g.75689  ORF g.75689 m.75689 type:complete len:1017 (-) comp17182_c0_seq1:114-3164(-)